jgi:AcrR family transcriptional regulator
MSEQPEPTQTNPPTTSEDARHRTEHSRDRLAAMLAPVFLKRGYEGATLTQLAEATGLGKASLYHHFPGGKAEMAADLLRRCAAELQHLAFRYLSGKQKPERRLARFIDGFADYCEGGQRPCLLAILAQGSAAEVHGEAIGRQYGDWLAQLAATFGAMGYGSKRARREAERLMSELYGALLMTALATDPGYFQRTVKRLRKTFG